MSDLLHVWHELINLWVWQISVCTTCEQAHPTKSWFGCRNVFFSPSVCWWDRNIRIIFMWIHPSDWIKDLSACHLVNVMQDRLFGLKCSENPVTLLSPSPPENRQNWCCDYCLFWHFIAFKITMTMCQAVVIQENACWNRFQIQCLDTPE